MMNNMFEVGDVVVPDQSSSDFPLHSGCGVYTHAIVIQVEPFVIVSEESDMKWGNTNSDNFIRMGKAEPEVLKRCMRRLNG
jgi:hypothetical protein